MANTFILSHIFDTFNLKGYSGRKTPGVRVGWAPLHSLVDHSSTEQDGLGDDGEDNNEPDEDAEDQYGLIEYLNKLSVH